MENCILIYPGNEHIGNKVAEITGFPVLGFMLRSFPDGESYIRLLKNVDGKKVHIICSLNQPDSKTIPLILLAETARNEGAAEIVLIAPYLAYMRQDIKFNSGESVSASNYAKIISPFFNSIITIDPHLHRIHDLNEIYSIPSKVLHSAPYISGWIKNNIQSPLIVGPDEESYQWVEEVAKGANAPFIVLKKTRYSDKDVKIEMPDVNEYRHRCPVLIDDIISSAHTMHQTVMNLKEAGMNSPVCIGVHGIFGEDAFRLLQSSGARIITTNSIIHSTNQIDMSPLIAGTIS